MSAIGAARNARRAVPGSKRAALAAGSKRQRSLAAIREDVDHAADGARRIQAALRSANDLDLSDVIDKQVREIEGRRRQPGSPPHRRSEPASGCFQLREFGPRSSFGGRPDELTLTPGRLRSASAAWRIWRSPKLGARHDANCGSNLVARRCPRIESPGTSLDCVAFGRWLTRRRRAGGSRHPRSAGSPAHASVGRFVFERLCVERRAFHRQSAATFRPPAPPQWPHSSRRRQLPARTSSSMRNAHFS